jgi:hypothetical protein
MLQTIEAVIDEQGRVHLLEKVELGKFHRALVTILKSDTNGNSESKLQQNESIVGSGELIDEDLEAGSREIAAMFNEAIAKSAKDLED